MGFQREDGRAGAADLSPGEPWAVARICAVGDGGRLHRSAAPVHAAGHFLG